MRLAYVSHPQVRIDPDVPVTDWALSDEGADRARAMAAVWPGPGWRVISSPEGKARQTATILVPGQRVEIAPDTGEVDRSATGYVSFDGHEALACALFERPDASAGGWERAADAQARMVAALHRLGDGGDLLMVGHGAVGTFLLCHIAGCAIDRAQDQPFQGHVWQAERGPYRWRLRHGWRPYEATGR